MTLAHSYLNGSVRWTPEQNKACNAHNILDGGVTHLSFGETYMMCRLGDGDGAQQQQQQQQQ